ncbi:YdcF family protein [Candidatus Pseudoscillospira sp. SGI.172]|uniref:YdcF family protein n=1 Tax=Candidatus Pseudoscillospira sp. SGI.172 TaxID=3420582 RepID=UPI0009BBE4AE|nr:YdcF family protein [Pseudoflavonifractor sp.]MDY3019693.1 YdcF family protein [Oscillospiraceae bacterium]
MKMWDGRSGYSGRHRGLRGALLLLLAAAILFFAAVETGIVVHGRTRMSKTPEILVIFGCKVESWGPSVLLRDRLDTALEYLDGHPGVTVVVTGGKGDDERQSEAQCMYDYLTAHGVDGETILMEDASRNTWQNVNYTLDLLAGKGYSTDGTVAAVSSGFHLQRIEMLWERAGGGTLAGTLAAPVSHKPSAVQMFFREPLALVKSFVFDR